MRKLIVAVLLGSLLLGAAAPAFATWRNWQQKVSIRNLGSWIEREKRCEYTDEGYLDYCYYEKFRVWKFKAVNKTDHRIHVACRFKPYDRNGAMAWHHGQWVDFGRLRNRGWWSIRKTDWFPERTRYLKYWCDVDRVPAR